jgi:SAM-dependent methyltransferase
MRAAAQTWPWERMARSNADSHETLVAALAPAAGERWLDVGTGSGGLALIAARAGARVTGIDVAAEAIEEARKHEEAEFLVADAQALPFPDASFDVVASAFGVNFAHDHAVAAAELARVCRLGGRLGLALLPADSRAGELWTLIRRYGAEGDHPGSFAGRVDELLGEWFDLETRLVDTVPEEWSPEEAWGYLRESFGPLRELLTRLDQANADTLREDFLAIRRRFDGRPKTYVLVLGRRR